MNIKCGLTTCCAPDSIKTKNEIPNKKRLIVNYKSTMNKRIVENNVLLSKNLFPILNPNFQLYFFKNLSSGILASQNLNLRKKFKFKIMDLK